jgi:tRNA (mo5U34)-methyltransferase
MPAQSQSRETFRWTPRRIERRVKKLGEWFHNIELNGVQTAPQHKLGDYPTVKWKRFAHTIPANLHGKSVLDIGCNAGFYSLEMKRRGAARVLGIDTSETYLEQARFVAAVSGMEIEFRKLSIYQLFELRETFDVVLCMGVLYHLRHPLLALDLIRKYAAAELVVLQSMLRGSSRIYRTKADYPFDERDVFRRTGYPVMHFVEENYCGDPTNWWIPNASCLEALIRSAGFEIFIHPESEVYLCRPQKKLQRAGDVLSPPVATEVVRP